MGLFDTESNQSTEEMFSEECPRTGVRHRWRLAGGNQELIAVIQCEDCGQMNTVGTNSLADYPGWPTDETS